MCPTRPRSTSPPPPVDATARDTADVAARDAADVAARGDADAASPPNAAPAPSRPRLPLVALTRPRCPRCGGARLRRYRSVTDQGDGTTLSWVKCRADECGHRFRLLLE